MYKDNNDFENRYLLKIVDNIYKDINVIKNKIVNFIKKYYKFIIINEIMLKMFYILFIKEVRFLLKKI